MAIQGRTQLKTYFETGDRPTQQQFYNLIESMFNYADDSLPTGGGSEVTDSGKQTAAQLNSNWVNPSDGDDRYYYKYTGTAITGQSENDYFIGEDSATTSVYKYQFVKIATVLSLIRIPLQLR